MLSLAGIFFSEIFQQRDLPVALDPRHGRRFLLLGSTDPTKKSREFHSVLAPLGKLLGTMFKENNKGKGEDREQGQLENRGYQTPHGRNSGLIVTERRKDEPEGIV